MKSLVALVTALCNPLVRMDQKERKEKSALVPRKPSLFRGELFSVYPHMSHVFAFIGPALQESVDSFAEIRDFVARNLK